MLTRRELIKGGSAAALVGLSTASLGSRAAAASVVGPAEDSGVNRPADAPFRRGGPGPLYWSTYAYNFSMNRAMPEHVWQANVDWVAETFRSHGYTMVCTDGWVDTTQDVTSHGYIRSLSDSWTHDWAWWAKYVKARGLEAWGVLQPIVGHQVCGDGSVRQGHRAT